MTNVTAAAAAESTPMKTVLTDGVSVLSNDESLTFTLYQRSILPLDGFVFWIRADLLVTPPPVTSLVIKGAVHRSVSNQQDEDQTQSLNHLIFTTDTRVDDFNLLDSSQMWVCTIEGSPFSFASMLDKFVSAGLYHYRGDSISPIVRGQMINSSDELNLNELVISNSLPLLMQLSQYCPVYPAFLVPSNIAPPYAVIDVRETIAIQSAPSIDPDNRWQFVRDTVRATLIGLNNHVALKYRDYIVNAALTYENFGVTNIPVVKDVKMLQSEINALAMKKTIDFEVNYYQQTANDIALQLINQVLFTVEVQS